MVTICVIQTVVQYAHVRAALLNQRMFARNGNVVKHVMLQSWTKTVVQHVNVNQKVLVNARGSCVVCSVNMDSNGMKMDVNIVHAIHHRNHVQLWSVPKHVETIAKIIVVSTHRLDRWRT
jgi:ABC-type transporter Mla MlaB component